MVNGRDPNEILIGTLTETAPGTDTASSGLNGRLQRIAQRLTSLIALLPTALTTAGNLKVTNLPETSGGCTAYELVSAASTNATNIKNSAGQVYGVQVFNLNAAAHYLKFYNTSSAPNPASDTVVKSIMIPGNTAGAGVVVPFPYAVAFSTGISFALVAGISNTDNTAVAANEIVVNIDYK